jgi:hypothetical protein
MRHGRILSSLIAVALIACTRGEPAVPWDTAQMGHELTRELREFEGLQTDLRQAEVLAWRVYEREDGAHVQVALIWARLDDRTWALLQGFRRPDEDSGWHRSVTDAPPAPSAQLRPGEDQTGTWHAFQRYPQPPSSRQICDFARVDFLRDPPEGYRAVAGAVRHDNWLRVVGQEPRCDVACKDPGCGGKPG